VRGPAPRPAKAGGVISLNAAPIATGRRILVVDDQRDVRHVASILLTSAGHRVEAAENGQAALSIARRFHPEVVISDIGLPGSMDGCRFAAALKSDPDLALAYLVAVTGSPRAQDRERALESGFDEVLVKPLDYVALIRALALLPSREGSDSRDDIPGL
jgi:CheY-like chemotaxis protein